MNRPYPNHSSAHRRPAARRPIGRPDARLPDARPPATRSTPRPRRAWLRVLALAVALSGLSALHPPAALAQEQDALQTGQPAGQQPPRGAALPGLAGEQDIFDRLVLGAVVSEIYRNCDRIAPRKVKATMFVLGTVKMAKDKGYSMDEIDAFRNDPEQQERLRQAVYAFFDENGVDRDDPESYCAFGLDQIRKKSRIGKYLKRK